MLWQSFKDTIKLMGITILFGMAGCVVFGPLFGFAALAATTNSLWAIAAAVYFFCLFWAGMFLDRKYLR